MSSLSDAHISASSRPRQRLASALRWTLTLGLLAIVATQVDFGQMAGLFAGVQWTWLGLAFALAAVDRVAATVRWWLLLRIKAVNIRFWPLLNLHLAANFIGSFLPTSFGADAARIVMLSKRTGQPVEAIAASAVDRLIMILGTLFLAASVSILIITAAIPPALRWLMLAVCIASVVLVAIAVVAGRVGPVADATRQLLGERVSAKVATLYWSMHEYRRYPRALALGSLITVVMLASRILIMAFVAWSFGVQLGLLAFLMLWPIAAVVLMLPISIGNFGLQEGVFVALLGTMGVAATTAVSISLVEHVLARAIVLPGALLWAADSSELPTKEVAERKQAKVNHTSCSHTFHIVHPDVNQR